MRLYTASFTNVAIAAAQDLFGLLATANMAFKVHWIELGQKTQSSWAALDIQLIRNTATITPGSGGSAVTPVPKESGNAAATVTARANDTTGQTTSGTAATLFSREWELLNGLFWMPAPEQRPTIAPGQGLQVRLGSAPPLSITASGSIMFEEIL